MAFQIKLKIDGLNELMQRFSPEACQEFTDHINDQIMLPEVQTGIVNARNRAPVRTGRLRDSLELKDRDRVNMSITAGTDVEYAHFPEFGTVKMHARPYWRPAIWEAFYRIMDQVKRFIDDFVRDR